MACSQVVARLVENCSRVTDAGNVQLIAGRFAPSFDFRDDPAIFDACVLDRHDQLLMPVDLSAAGVVGDNTEDAFVSLFEFAQNPFERQEVGSVFLDSDPSVCMSNSPER